MNNDIRRCVVAWMILSSVFHAGLLCAEPERMPHGSATELAETIRAKKDESKKLNEEAHKALDAQQYERAVELHRRSRALAAEAEVLSNQQDKVAAAESGATRAKQDEAAARTAAEHIPNLGHADFRRRREASEAIFGIGPQVLPHLLAAMKETRDPEVIVRLTDLLQVFGDVRVDNEGRFRQWARKAKASSQYGETGWSASQATGKPDTTRSGDYKTAWAPKVQDGGEEWLELDFSYAVTPSLIRIHETYNPGALIKVDVLDDQGEWHRYWQGRDPTDKSPQWFEVRPTEKEALTFPTRRVRITLDTKSVSGWNEIDAVELVGDH
ncbi:MAG: hypothetical protein AAF492_00120 [Verrucomicrobiota bacterium]